MTEKNIRPSCQTRRMLASACSSISARVMVDSSPLLRLRFLSVMADRSCYVTFCTTRVHALRRMHDRDVLRVLPVKVNVPLCVLPADALPAPIDRCLCWLGWNLGRPGRYGRYGRYGMCLGRVTAWYHLWRGENVEQWVRRLGGAPRSMKWAEGPPHHTHLPPILASRQTPINGG